jgi:hypothetical protein
VELAGGEPDPVECAQRIAPELDRVRLAIFERMKSRLPEFARTHELSAPALSAVGYLRNVYPDRTFEAEALFAVFTYQPQIPVREGLEDLIASGHVASVTDTQLVLTDSGRHVIADIASQADSVARQLWPDAAIFEGITPLAENAVAAIDDGGLAYSVMAPPASKPDHLCAAGWFAELLTALRFHRFDCHIAAWHAAGLTVEEIMRLPDGPHRDAIEAETNRRSATPYRTLSPVERQRFVAGITALPSG